MKIIPNYNHMFKSSLIICLKHFFSKGYMLKYISSPIIFFCVNSCDSPPNMAAIFAIKTIDSLMASKLRTISGSCSISFPFFHGQIGFCILCFVGKQKEISSQLLMQELVYKIVLLTTIFVFSSLW